MCSCRRGLCVVVGVVLLCCNSNLNSIQYTHHIILHGGHLIWYYITYKLHKTIILGVVASIGERVGVSRRVLEYIVSV